MNDIISYGDFKLYNKYIKPSEYDKHIEPYIKLFKVPSKEDIDFRYLFYINKQLGLDMLSKSDPWLSIELGSAAYIGEIPMGNVKSVIISDILETTIYNITKEEVCNAEQKVDTSFIGNMIDGIKI